MIKQGQFIEYARTSEGNIEDTVVGCVMEVITRRGEGSCIGVLLIRFLLLQTQHPDELLDGDGLEEAQLSLR